MEQHDIQQRAVLVTGASGGIGMAIAKKLVESGYQVFLGYYKNSVKAYQAAKELGDKCIPVQMDVRDEHAVGLAAEFIEEKLAGRPLWGLINNAGVDGYGLLQDLSLNTWQYIMETNVTGTFLTTRAFLPQMIRMQAGCILNLSSIWGARGASCEVAYSTSKGAIDAFTRALAQEVAYCGIRVNALAPGVVETRMFEHLSIRDREDTLADIPFGRAASPDEIARYAAFILSEDASYLTGQVLTIAGGFVI